MKNKWYRIRCRDKKGKSFIFLDEIEDLEMAYYLIDSFGIHQHPSRKYYIDVIEPKLLSVVTVGVARKRLDEIRMEGKEDE